MFFNDKIKLKIGSKMFISMYKYLLSITTSPTTITIIINIIFI